MSASWDQPFCKNAGDIVFVCTVNDTVEQIAFECLEVPASATWHNKINTVPLNCANCDNAANHGPSLLRPVLAVVEVGRPVAVSRHYRCDLESLLLVATSITSRKDHSSYKCQFRFLAEAPPCVIMIVTTKAIPCDVGIQVDDYLDEGIKLRPSACVEGSPFMGVPARRGA